MVPLTAAVRIVENVSECAEVQQRGVAIVVLSQEREVLLAVYVFGIPISRSGEDSAVAPFWCEQASPRHLARALPIECMMLRPQLQCLRALMMQPASDSSRRERSEN